MVQNEFQKRRYVYSKALQGVSLSREGHDWIHVLCRTPTTIDLEPPKRSNCHNVLVEEVDDPAIAKVTGI